MSILNYIPVEKSLASFPILYIDVIKVCVVKTCQAIVITNGRDNVYTQMFVIWKNAIKRNKNKN